MKFCSLDTVQLIVLAPWWLYKIILIMSSGVISLDWKKKIKTGIQEWNLLSTLNIISRVRVWFYCIVPDSFGTFYLGKLSWWNGSQRSEWWFHLFFFFFFFFFCYKSRVIEFLLNEVTRNRKQNQRNSEDFLSVTLARLQISESLTDWT